MLSTENPPPDPCDELSQLKSCSSYNDNHQVDVDLFKSGLDDINHTLPKFSIRDYVFNARSKDIKNHWPFSPKNLQLCLKHGVKEILPPFQNLECVKNPSSTVKSDEENISENVGEKLASDSENFKSNPSEADNEYHPSTSVSRSDVNSVSFRTKSPLSESEAEILPGPSVEKSDFAVLAKKCRLVVKLGNNFSEQKSNEDLLLSKETMASNVCPVCKTFSSSSNTTLNAHIDQCLSGESTVKCMSIPKAIKHRIKPRKTRLMVDIYETALCCTLEDLDRRNGTNWASNLGFQAHDLENSNNNNNNNTFSSMNSEEKNEEGAVYFDSNGTKLRILSKFNDVQLNANVKDDCGPKKFVTRDQGSKIISSKKNTNLVQRHKLLKCPPYGERRCSPRLDYRPVVNKTPEIKFPSKECMEEDLAQPLKAGDWIKSNGSGMIKQWVGSTRTGHKKKKNMEQKSHRPNEVMKNSKSHLPSLDDKRVKRTRDSRFSISSDDNPISATESHKRKDNTPFNTNDEYMDRQPCRTNRAGFSLLDFRDCSNDKKNQLMPVKCNVEQLKEVGPSGNHDSSFSNKKMRIISPNEDHHIFSSGGKKFGSLKKTSMGQAILTGGKKLSSLNKNPLSVSHKSLSEAKKKLGRKPLDFKKTRLHYASGSDEDWVGENGAQAEKDSGNLSFDRARVSKFRKKKWGFVNTGKERYTPSKSSNASSESDSHGAEQKIDSFVDDIIVPAGTSNDDVNLVEIRDEFVREPISGISSGDALIIAFGESLGDEHKMSREDKVDQEGNYYVDVDPIPIPGPPGSFLPSPGRMASEELQGISSLTTCRLHSSEDERELINMGSSDSPISVRRGSQCDIVENQTELVTESSKMDESREKLVLPQTKFPNCGGDCESPSLSTSNPVLRLMGKNLMVVNREENMSQSIMVNEFSNVPSRVDDKHPSFHHTFSQGPSSVFGNTQTCIPMQRFDLMPNYRTFESSQHQSRVILSSSDERFRSNLDFHGYGGGYFFSPDQLGSKIVRPDGPIAHEAENEASLAFKTMYCENMESGARSRPTLGYNNDSRLANTFHNTFQTRCYPFRNGSQMDQNRNAHFPPNDGVNGNPVNWNIRAPDGLTDLSPSTTGHSRTSLYFTPGFSLHTNFT